MIFESARLTISRQGETTMRYVAAPRGLGRRQAMLSPVRLERDQRPPGRNCQQRCPDL